MINNRIKELRQTKHLSQEQLAEKAQISVRTIQRLEAGADASISTLNLVAGALGVEVGDLFEKTAVKKQQDKIESAAAQLDYQLDQRRKEFANFKKVYNIIYVIIMLCTLGLIPLLIIVVTPFLAPFLVVLWIGAWILMKPLEYRIGLNVVSPKLDQKYPLTVNRPHNNEVPAQDK
ncbi:MAG: helix-turn-helix domain-containing protein [Lactobacillus sp.]|jgi:transcriptional regulator with XRE-family HTH domain|nr:helix-turn-helix domain-containing protein [Lactobacillus sp.]MCI1973642.1 helix-turn-helix domain-containing protein [Lactobacillus sp.]